MQRTWCQNLLQLQQTENIIAEQRAEGHLIEYERVYASIATGNQSKNPMKCPHSQNLE